MDLKHILDYKNEHICERTVESDDKAVNRNETVYLPTEVYQKQIKSTDGRGIYWTDDINQELPITMAGSGIGRNLLPETICRGFLRAASLLENKKALFVQRNNKELTWTWSEFKDSVFAFAKGLYKHGLRERCVVNIMGFNSPEWLITLHGTLFLNGIQSGVYITNSADACHY